MQANATQEDRLAVQQDLSSTAFDSAEADLVGDSIAFGCNGYAIKPRSFRRPQFQRVTAFASRLFSTREIIHVDTQISAPAWRNRGFVVNARVGNFDRDLEPGRYAI